MVIIGARRYNFLQHQHDTEAQDNDKFEESSHYSYYAFDGATGALRWKHESKDFHNINQELKTYPQHNYKLDIKQHTQHSGEVHWRHYKEDILRNFPHRFRHPHDVSINVDRFEPSATKKLSDGGLLMNVFIFTANKMAHMETFLTLEKKKAVEEKRSATKRVSSSFIKRD